MLQKCIQRCWLCLLLQKITIINCMLFIFSSNQWSTLPCLYLKYHFLVLRLAFIVINYFKLLESCELHQLHVSIVQPGNEYNKKKLFKVKTVIKSSISETVFLHPKLANWLFQETKKWRQKIGCFSFDRALSECLKHWTKKCKITWIKRKRKINPKKCHVIKRKKVLLI